MKPKTITIPVELCVRWDANGVSLMLGEHATSYFTEIGAGMSLLGDAWSDAPLIVPPENYAPLLEIMLRAAEDSTEDVVTLDKFGAVEES